MVRPLTESETSVSFSEIRSDADFVFAGREYSEFIEGITRGEIPMKKVIFISDGRCDVLGWSGFMSMRP